MGAFVKLGRAFLVNRFAKTGRDEGKAQRQVNLKPYLTLCGLE
jgi:hypothetical protein